MFMFIMLFVSYYVSSWLLLIVDVDTLHSRVVEVLFVAIVLSLSQGIMTVSRSNPTTLIREFSLDFHSICVLSFN